MDELLQIENLSVVFRRGAAAPPVAALTDVSLTVRSGESVGLVGESGCGKSTLANAIVGLVAPSAGSVRFDGERVDRLRGAALRRFRKHAQVVFQDPLESLNARVQIGAALREVLLFHGLTGRGRACRERVAELLTLVGLSPDHARRYPHELSGGQRQRVGIARALAVEPRLIVADEAVSALDVSVQVQILNLLMDLRARLGLAYLFIAHDLAVVRYICPRVLVMYMGRIVEAAPTDLLVEHAAHPYTRALMAAAPDIDAVRGTDSEQEQVPAPRTRHVPPLRAAAGCPFHPRCMMAQGICRQRAPSLVQVDDGHWCACHVDACMAVGGSSPLLSG